MSVHAISPAAIDLVLDAFEAALGPTGPNPLRHRIKHAAQVTDEQLARPAGASRHLDDAVTRLTHIATILPG